MLNIKTKGLLLNIIKHCERIEEKIQECNKELFNSSDDIKEIVCFNLIQIGELTASLDVDFINQYTGIPWNKVKGMRNRIVHGYGTIAIDRVWKTATEDIKPLREYCDKIIKDN